MADDNNNSTDHANPGPRAFSNLAELRAELHRRVHQDSLNTRRDIQERGRGTLRTLVAVETLDALQGIDRHLERIAAALEAGPSSSAKK